MLPPFNMPLSRNLIRLVWYGILVTGMVIAVIGNYGLLKSRLEAFIPFAISEQNSFFSLSGIIAILITFAEVVMCWILLEGWTNPAFFRVDIDTIKSERPLSFTKAMFIVSCIMYVLIIGVDIAVAYQGNFIQTNSIFSSIVMVLLTIALSVTFGFLSFFCLVPFFIMVVAFLRNILSFIIECLAFVTFLIHGLLNNIMNFALSAIDVLAKIGEGTMKPFKNLQNKYTGEKLPIPAKIIIALVLIGMLSLAWSSQQLIISKKCIVVLVDLTGSFDYSRESFDHTDNIINALMPGDEIYILSITATSFYDKNLLFNASIPLPKYTSELYSEKYRAHFDSIRGELSHRWGKVVKNLRTDARKTDVMGGISYALLIFNNSKSKHKYLVIYSDLEDNVAGTGDVRLNGVRVWCLYVEHKDFEKYKEKENSWRQYFKRAGVEEKNIIIRIPAQSSEIKIK
ncbi:hypothetical protein ES703_44823 [subsurface metagenome]